MSASTDIRNDDLRGAIDTRVQDGVNRSLLTILDRLNKLDKGYAWLSKVVVALMVAVAFIIIALVFVVFRKPVSEESVNPQVFAVATSPAEVYARVNVERGSFEEEAPAESQAISEEEEQNDPWAEVRGCAVQAVRVRIFLGTLSELYDFLRPYGITDSASAEKYYAYDNGTAFYEITQYQLLWEPDRPLFMQGQWGTPLWEVEPTKEISSLDEIPSDLYVTVYNTNGYIGHGNTGSKVELTEPVRCHEDHIENISWTDPSEWELINTIPITYGNLEGVVDGGFITAFYAGKTLTYNELRHLEVTSGSFSGGFPLVGGGSSTHGMFVWDPHTLQIGWSAADYDGVPFKSTRSFTSSVQLPTLQEIIIQTINFYDWPETTPYVHTWRIVVWQQERENMFGSMTTYTYYFEVDRDVDVPANATLLSQGLHFMYEHTPPIPEPVFGAKFE